MDTSQIWFICELINKKWFKQLTKLEFGLSFYLYPSDIQRLKDGKSKFSTDAFALDRVRMLAHWFRDLGVGLEKLCSEAEEREKE